VKELLGVPHGHDDSVFIVSVSGGKDSAALAAEMKRLAEETGITVRYVFADTGWEAPQTYEYLRTLERELGITIEWVGKPGGMRAAGDGGARFPSRVQRWCTRELKIEPLRAYHARVAAELDCETVNVVGLRAEESEARAKLAEFEDSEEWGGYVWRPLIRWTVADVLAAHHRAGIPVNPLYKLGFSRVGCLCINASKEEIRLFGEHFPEWIDEVEVMEAAGSAERARRNVETPGRYSMEEATFFQKIVKGEDGKRHGAPFPIREAVAWSRTSRGGVQLRLIQESPDSGCFRWGMCEPPEKGDE
jgi:3'-phosphoadenosine 5'-phosphosulfate sulfotransferase (PAPS reductase)/FAD synthetase